MNDNMTVQWFPGHMAKTRRLIKETLNIVDAVAEIVDARVPLSSQNPELESIVADKPRVVLLNKCDMADEAITQEWIEYYKDKGVNENVLYDGVKELLNLLHKINSRLKALG